jgi:predicted adenine nucleotide alpha hydrolase (AANH) superfamily ATPase
MVFVEIKHDDKSISWITLECILPEIGELFEIRTYAKNNIKAEKTYKKLLVIKKKELFALRDMINQYIDKHFDDNQNWYQKGRSMSNDDDNGARKDKNAKFSS